MSIEVLEVSVAVEEKFDVSFNLTEGLFGLILKLFGR
ncbi:MAG: phenylalanyl-tRNA synthetase subunit alpha [Bacteroidota bacterium]